VRGRDGYVFDGYRIRVEFPRSSTRGGSSGGNSFRGGDGYGRKFRPKGGHQLLVSGLPPTGSWQDVKDHFREAGDVVYADVYKDGTGVMEFSCYEHMKRAHIHTHMHIHTHTHTQTYHLDTQKWTDLKFEST